ncbi:MAG: tRNA 4-thiouridine(8) synthase ThiI, partial [Planctomycetes bacterium]|nr:tRNA 4-thiouridine(8) synthase ThiI [Planctomycetota bacterium]
MQEIIQIHYGELALKGGIRKLFEQKLAENIAQSVVDLGKVKVRRLYGRMVLDPVDVAPAAILPRLARVFGIAHFGRAWMTDMSWESLLAATTRVLPEAGVGRFGVRVKRADDHWSRSRSETERELGTWIQTEKGWSVDLTNPDLWVRVSIANGRIMVAGERFEGSRGLPVGASGRGLALLSGGIDSPVAAWMMMSRGLRLGFAHFHSAPFTNQRSQDKVVELAETLLAYQSRIRLYMVPFADLQREIVEKAPQAWRILLYRRFMMRVASRLARKERALALVTGESLGQVASQTLSNLHTVESATEHGVLRPLVGLDK